ncbi:BfmA/BtgA family mobilization protein [Chloroflexota bacterium]
MVIWYIIITMVIGRKTQMMSQKGKTIRLKSKTVEKLDKLKHQGQSYDGIIAEIIDFYTAEQEGTSNKTAKST